ncbi:MAG: cell division protein FtsB [Polaribacter sp.]|jgi:cell division protein FtsB
MSILIRILLFLIPATFIYLFVKEYKKQKEISEETWSDNWEQKKKNFQLDQDLKAKEREIEKLKDKLKDGE